MTNETTFIERMRFIATHPAARGLLDDVAVVELGKESLILTHDVMIEGVHWNPNTKPKDVAWRLVASNLSDLAAKGAQPLGLLLGYVMGDSEWDRAFANGLEEVLLMYPDIPLLGGDTVSSKSSGPKILGMTAIGRATFLPVPSRAGANAGDDLYVTGTLGDAMLGCEFDRTDEEAPPSLLAAYYWWPKPLLDEGLLLAPHVSAIMDVSDGLLLDASRMAKASGLTVAVDISAVPLSADYIAVRGDDHDARIAASTWGDDYQLLFALSPDVELPVPASRVGRFADNRFAEGDPIRLFDGEKHIPLPPTLGYQHH